jgi:hypothetical protein
MGILAVLLVRANESSSVLATGLVAPVRVWATVIAVALTMAVELLVRCSHPPSVATTVPLSLGALPPTWQTALAVLMGVVVAGVLGGGATSHPPARAAPALNSNSGAPISNAPSSRLSLDLRVELELRR